MTPLDKAIGLFEQYSDGPINYEETRDQALQLLEELGPEALYFSIRWMYKYYGDRFVSLKMIHVHKRVIMARYQTIMVKKIAERRPTYDAKNRLDTAHQPKWIRKGIAGDLFK